MRSRSNRSWSLLTGSFHAPVSYPLTSAASAADRGNKDNVRLRVIAPVVSGANEIRAAEDRPPIRTHVTPHTFRRPTSRT